MPPARRSVVPGAVLGSAAGAALVTGIGLFAGGRAKQSSIQAQHDAIASAGRSCVAGAPNEDPSCADLYSSASTANTLEKAGVGLMIGGGAAGIATALYFLLPPSSSATPNAGGLRITPTVSASTAGLILSGTF